MAVGDVNGDSHPDLVVANYSGSTLSVLLNNGNGTCAPKVDYATGSSPLSVAVGDLNGDGHPDLVVTNGGDDTASVLLNNGNGTFAPKVDYATGAGPVSVVVTDLNGDGHPDLVVANLNDSTVSVLLNVSVAPSVPGVSPWGIMAMVLLFDGAMFWLVRRRLISGRTF